MGIGVKKNGIDVDAKSIEKKKSLLFMDIKSLKKMFTKKSESQEAKSTKNKKRNLVSFDIGSTTIKIVQGAYYKGKLSIDNCIKIKTPTNAVIDGEIKDEEAIITMIGAALRQYSIRAKDAICTTNPSSVINREIIVPKVDREELETVVRYEIKQYLPINLDECILQMTVLGEVEDEFEGKTKLNVRVIAYPKSIALEYYKLLNNLGLRPYALDINFNALNKFVNHTDIAEFENEIKSSIALIDMGANFIDINIYKDNKLDFTRRIKVGGNDIDNVLINDGDFEPKTIMSVKQNNIDLQEDGSLAKVETKLVEDVLDEWIEKIEMILQFYKNVSLENTIKNIFLFGGSSRFKGLNKYMSEKLGINVSNLSDASNIAFKKYEYNGGILSDFVNAIGAVIRL